MNVPAENATAARHNPQSRIFDTVLEIFFIFLFTFLMFNFLFIISILVQLCVAKDGKPHRSTDWQLSSTLFLHCKNNGKNSETDKLSLIFIPV
jgi:hypothetical protein